MEFLRAVAIAFRDSFEGHLFVFPNRRSIRFFQKYLGEEYCKAYGKPLFAPRSVTINDLFLELSGLKPVDPIAAQYLLYSHYIDLRYRGKREKEPFDEFINWGNIIIADFNDIDKYLIDARQLFSNIKDLKEIDGDFSYLTQEQRNAISRFWGNFLRGGENFKKESFTSLWAVMYELYCRFKATLIERGEGYEGMIYRSVAENVGKYDLSNLVFVGFNAPNRCERELMRHSRDNGGDFYWDFYGSMVTDRENKASLFVDWLRRDFPSSRKLSAEVEQVTMAQELKIELYGVPSGVGGALVACDILKRHIGEEAVKSAILLPDEKLLMPLLSSIPKEFERVNVTMGYPVAATPLPDLMNLLAELQKSVVEREGESLFYHAPVRALLSHVYLKKAAEEECNAIISNIINGNRIYIPANEPLFAGAEAAVIRKLFLVKRSTKEIIEWQMEFLKELDTHTGDPDSDFIYQYYNTLERLKELDLPLEKGGYFKLLRQITSLMTIPFKGEPLEGLQVMGPLEVRSLDFDNLIILSANEGTFPANGSAPSLIPYNLRIGFGLPTYEEQDAISAYHFYRSISRAKNLYMIYDSRTEGLARGEESRYVKQLRYHYECDIHDYSIHYKVMDEERPIGPIQKSGEIMDRLRNLYIGDGGGYLSASAINCYIDCQRKFYYTYIEGIRDETEIVEELDVSKFGELFHTVMQRLYKGYIDRTLTSQELEKMRKEKSEIAGALIEDYFREQKLGRITGENLIVKEVIKRYVAITLEEDSKIAPIVLKDLEKRVLSSVSIPEGRVRLKAIIDRIDLVGGELRIVDYKTGSVNDAYSRYSMEKLFNIEKKQYKELFQLFFYAYILTLDGYIEKEEGREYNLVIYKIPTLLKDSFIPFKVTGEDIARFGEMLQGCLCEIFDSQLPFEPCRWSVERCGECKFRLYCTHLQ